MSILARYRGALNSLSALVGGVLDIPFITQANATSISGSASFQDLAIQTDQKILLVGRKIFSGTPNPGIARINQDGSLDTSITFPMLEDEYPGASTDDTRHPNLVAVQADGKILISGDSAFTVANGAPGNGVIRLNADGSLDTDFNNNIGTGPDARSYDIAIQADGKILLAGAFTTFNGATANRIVRLNADGSLDTAFNNNIGTGFDNVSVGIAIQADGKIVISGIFTTFNGAAANRIVRLNADGSLDTAFNNNIGTGFESNSVGIAIQADGKIVISGSFTTFNGATANRIVRLNADGSLDTAFNNNIGTGFNSSSSAIEVQADGKIVISGAFTTFNGATVGPIVRLNDDGSLDTDFSNNIISFGISRVGSIDFAIQDDNNIIATRVTGSGDFSILKRFARIGGN